MKIMTMGRGRLLLLPLDTTGACLLHAVLARALARLAGAFAFRAAAAGTEYKRDPH